MLAYDSGVTCWLMILVMPINVATGCPMSDAGHVLVVDAYIYIDVTVN